VKINNRFHHQHLISFRKVDPTFHCLDSFVSPFLEVYFSLNKQVQSVQGKLYGSSKVGILASLNLFFLHTKSLAFLVQLHFLQKEDFPN
jgi:hypothetical protein